VSDDETDEVSETARFTLHEAPHRIALADLPLSPKKVFVAATKMGWDVRAWLSTGEFAPVLYKSTSKASDKKKHSIGEELYEGFLAGLYVVEARDPETRAVGFQATFLGKTYFSGKAKVGGSFEAARVADPVGIPHLLSATYKAIPVTKAKFETERSFNDRVMASSDMAKRQLGYNDGTYFYSTTHLFTTSGEFDAWLAEWRSFTQRETNV